jgi:hypothetical protein
MVSIQDSSIAAGDARAGFEARIDKQVRRLHVRLWGIWDATMAKSFVAAVDRLGRELGPMPWTSLVDARRFVVQDPLIEPHRQESLKVAASLGCGKMATLVESSVYALQFKRLADRGHLVSQTFKDMHAAVTWLGQAETASPSPRGRLVKP